jgi:hypothetical protein
VRGRHNRIVEGEIFGAPVPGGWPNRSPLRALRDWLGRRPEPERQLAAGEIDAIRRQYDNLVAGLRADVRATIDPEWDVDFEYANGRWWFAFADGSHHGSFNGVVIELAVYIEEDHGGSTTWPSCDLHDRALRLKSDGPSVRWSCDGPPPHDAPVGSIDRIARR